MSKRYGYGVGAVVAVMIAAGGVLAGELTPPGPPGATMKTLQEIYDKIDEPIESSSTASPPNCS